MNRSVSDSPSAPAPSFYLPDFCATQTVLAVVLIAELVALVLTLAREELQHGFWIDLARTSLFLLWIGLSSAAVLCYTRPVLARMSVQRASAVSLGLLVAVTLVISEVTFWLGQRWFGGLQNAVGSLFPSNHATFLLRNLFIAFIVNALALRYFYIAYEWRRTVEGRARLRIDALQARIRPHFLFNSMNTIPPLPARTRPRPRKRWRTWRTCSGPTCARPAPRFRSRRNWKLHAFTSGSRNCASARDSRWRGKSRTTPWMPS